MSPLTGRAADMVARAFPLMSSGVRRFTDLELSFGDMAPELPVLAEELPHFVNTAASFVDHTSERQAFIVSSLCLTSGVLPWLTGSYGTRHYSPNLFVVIFGEPGSGKGMVGTTTRLVAPLNERIRNEALDGLERPSRPPCILLSGNSSSAALYDQVQVNGGTGIMVETEVDALLSAMKNDWGDMSHFLRQAFENETVSISRVKHGDQIFIPSPRLSCLLAGTPGQILRLLPSPEDGLVSRILYHRARHDAEWRSGRPTSSTVSFDRAIDSGAVLLDGVHAALSARERPLPFILREADWITHDSVFGAVKRWGQQLDASGAFTALVHRAGVIAFRIAMTVSTIRAFEQGIDLQFVESLEAGPSDVEAGLLLALHGLDHGTRLLDVLPDAPVLTTGKERQMADLWNALPESYSGPEMVRIAGDIGISRRSAYLYNEELRKAGAVVASKHGFYQKAPSGLSPREWIPIG